MLDTNSIYVPENEVLRMLVEKAKTVFNDDPCVNIRIHRGAELVEQGAVSYNSLTSAIVCSKGTQYHVTNTCTCMDMKTRNKPCKHVFARWLALRTIKGSINNG